MNTLGPRFMGEAIALAQKGVGRTAPNPPVGAVIVQNQCVVGRGFHPKAGQPHAEIFALREAGNRTRDADVFVTLEPCSHHGRTGPCADALIEAGVGRVFIGCLDPNPQVSGRGVQRLQDAGIEVHTGLCHDRCAQLIEPFAKHVQTGLPFALYKSAMTLDGQTACSNGDSRWVSGEKSREEVHALRNEVDVIMVGIGTLLADDPALTARCPEGRDPVRLIVDEALCTPIDAQVLTQSSEAPTLIATTVSEDHPRVAELEAAGAQLLFCSSDRGRVDLSHLWQQLGAAGYYYVLLEGGATLASAALEAGLIDRVRIYLAPKFLGGAGQPLFGGHGVEKMADAIGVKRLRYRNLGEDLVLEGDL